MTMLSLSTLAFADLESAVWGVVLDLGAGQPAVAILGEGRDGGPRPASLRLEGHDVSEPWNLRGPSVELSALPAGEAGSSGTSFMQLAEMRGRLDGAEIRCPGMRGRLDRLDPAGLLAVRGVWAWFGSEYGLGLIAGRPRGAIGHADDLVHGAVLEDGRSLPVADPRLSTTYAADGRPARAGLELWLEPPEESARQTEADQDEYRYPRRAAGEAVGPGRFAADGPLDVHAELFRWHARGRQGAGVYVVARIGAG